MKIKNIIIYYPSFERGGVEKILVNISKFFIEKKINVNLVTIKNKNNNFLKQSKYFKITNIVVKKNFIFNRYTTSLACLLPLIRVIKSKNNTDTIVHSMQSNILAIIAAKIFGFKVVARNSEDAISSTKHAEEKVFSKIIFLIKFLFYHIADGIITNSKGSANSLNKFLINKSLVKYIYNPYLTKNKILLAKKNNYKKKNIILTVGRLCKQKNFKDLIIAFRNFHAKNPEYKLHIFGDGYEKVMLKNLINSLKLNNNVFLKGYRKDLKSEYKKAKLFVLPSIYEGLGNVLIEALNYSVPCISTNCKSGPSEILSYGRGGYIVPIKNIDALTKTLLNSINNYDTSIKKMKYGKKKLNRFLISTQSTKYLEELNSVL